MVIIIDEDKGVGDKIMKTCFLQGISCAHYRSWKKAKAALELKPTKWDMVMIYKYYQSEEGDLREILDWLETHRPDLPIIFLDNADHIEDTESWSQATWDGLSKPWIRPRALEVRF